jgi:hypothetical protein
MSRVGLADNSHSAPRLVGDHGFESQVDFRQPANILNANFRNQCRHDHFSSIPAQIAGAIWNTEPMSAGRMAPFATKGLGSTGLELTRHPCLDEAISALAGIT